MSCYELPPGDDPHHRDVHTIVPKVALAKLLVPDDLDRDGGTYMWWTEPELRGITASAGLVNFQRFRCNRVIMLCVQKPSKH